MMNIFLWILQIALALLFLVTGMLKVTQPKEALIGRMHALEELKSNQIKMIGTVEILAFIGLIFPHLTGILPWLTPLAAVGCALLMIGATATHLRRNESPLVTVLIGILSLVVVFGRFILVPA